jgi:hypothetical protein
MVKDAESVCYKVYIEGNLYLTYNADQEDLAIYAAKLFSGGDRRGRVKVVKEVEVFTSEQT